MPRKVIVEPPIFRSDPSVNIRKVSNGFVVSNFDKTLIAKTQKDADKFAKRLLGEKK